MYALDFEYDNRCLSDFGFMICDFDFSSGAVVVNTGSQITFTKVPVHSGRRNILTGAKYEECIQSTFDICKDPNLYDGDEREITSDEYREIGRWLNRRMFLQFRLLPEEDSVDLWRETYFYNVSFNVQKITIRDRTYGIRLSLESDGPFGYGELSEADLSFSKADEKKVIYDLSDEVGELYPDIEITCKKSGTLSLKNNTLGYQMEIKNCSVGEKITVLGERQIILSSLSSHTISEDFNYEFLKIGNTLDSRENEIEVSAPCEITITYRPLIRDFA